MNWINKFEKMASPIAVPGLIRYVAFLNSAVFVLGLASRQQENSRLPDIISMLTLHPLKVLQGEVWRVLTFAFIPSSFSLFWIFALLFMFYIGDSLEQAMGATRLTLYYLMGLLATVGASFIFGMQMDATFLNLSLLLAFGTLFPETPISLYFVIQIKVKWLAILSLVFALVAAVSAGMAGIAALAVGLLNYLLFFGPALVRGVKLNTEIAQRRHEFRVASQPLEDTLHRCKICERTEKVDADLEFRVAADGEEYCLEHLPAKGT